MSKVQLIPQGERPGSSPGTYCVYVVMWGNVRIGVVNHRISMDTYNVIFDDAFQALNADRFGLLVYPFNAKELGERIEQVLRELLDGLKGKFL